MAVVSVYVVVVLGAAVAGFVQGLSGFAFGLVAMSFWVWVLDPQLAATLAVFGALCGQIIAAFSVRRGFDIRLLAPFVVGGLLGVPLGAGLLPRLDMDMFKVILGSILVLWCPAMLFSARLPKFTRGGRLADGVVGLGGGLMSGLGGFTGTLPTLWCTLRGYERHVQRSLIQNFNLSMLSVTMAIYFTSGMLTADVVPFFVAVLPAMLIPSFLGTRVYVGMSDLRFRQLVLSLLTASGVALLASSIPSLLVG